MGGMDPVGAATAPRVERRDAEPDLARAARQFEGLLLQQMLRSAETPIGGGEPLLDGGPGGRMYRSLFYEHAAELSARRGGLGIAELLIRQLGSAEDVGRTSEEKP